MYVLIRDNQVEEYPYSIKKLKEDNPGTSFPSTLSEEFLAEWKVYSVVQNEPPSRNTITQNLREDDPQLIAGAWEQTWLVESASTEQINARTEERAQEVRNTRDQLLRDNVDKINPIWWNTLDNNQKNEWTIYRQALLDVPQQDEFPLNITWPNPPTF